MSKKMKKAKQHTIVIKLGSSSIIDERTHLPIVSTLAKIVETAVSLRSDGHRVVIVSSGAIAVGLRRMDLEKRPKHLSQVQAVAAIGQGRLMKLWDMLFDENRQPVAQVLLTRNDISNRSHYQNAQATLLKLLDMGVIPIVNENDTIAVAEIKFGDNDTLSAITATMVQASYLFLMTDVDCLYDSNPRLNPNARAIEDVSDISELAADVSSAGSKLGTGGMATKIEAARQATSSGVTTIITRSSRPENVHEIVKYLGSLARSSGSSLSLEGETLDGDAAQDDTLPSQQPKQLSRPLHTRFLPSKTPVNDRYFWILHGIAPRGTVYIDEGAYKQLLNRASLFPAGIIAVEGEFSHQAAVRLVVVRRLARPVTSGGVPLGRSLPALDQSTSSLAGYEGSTSSDVVTSEQEPLFEKDSPPPREVGRAIVEYSSAEIVRIKGLNSAAIQKELGYSDTDHVAFVRNISLADRSLRADWSGTTTPSNAETFA